MRIRPVSAILAGLLLPAAVAVAAIPAPAHAACGTATARTTKVLLYGDDELNQYATGYVALTRNANCSITARYGYYPTYGGTLSCHATRALTINPTSHRGTNIAAARLPCRGAGAAATPVTYWPTGTDSSFSFTMTADVVWSWDPSVTSPVRYL